MAIFSRLFKRKSLAQQDTKYHLQKLKRLKHSEWVDYLINQIKIERATQTDNSPFLANFLSIIERAKVPLWDEPKLFLEVIKTPALFSQLQATPEQLKSLLIHHCAEPGFRKTLPEQIKDNLNAMALILTPYDKFKLDSEQIEEVKTNLQLLLANEIIANYSNAETIKALQASLKLLDPIRRYLIVSNTMQCLPAEHLSSALKDILWHIVIDHISHPKFQQKLTDILSYSDDLSRKIINQTINNPNIYHKLDKGNQILLINHILEKEVLPSAEKAIVDPSIRQSLTSEQRVDFMLLLVDNQDSSHENRAKHSQSLKEALRKANTSLEEILLNDFATLKMLMLKQLSSDIVGENLKERFAGLLEKHANLSKKIPLDLIANLFHSDFVKGLIPGFSGFNDNSYREGMLLDKLLAVINEYDALYKANPRYADVITNPKSFNHFGRSHQTDLINYINQHELFDCAKLLLREPEISSTLNPNDLCNLLLLFLDNSKINNPQDRTAKAKELRDFLNGSNHIYTMLSHNIEAAQQLLHRNQELAELLLESEAYYNKLVDKVNLYELRDFDHKDPDEQAKILLTYFNNFNHAIGMENLNNKKIDLCNLACLNPILAQNILNNCQMFSNLSLTEIAKIISAHAENDAFIKELPNIFAKANIAWDKFLANPKAVNIILECSACDKLLDKNVKERFSRLMEENSIAQDLAYLLITEQKKDFLAWLKTDIKATKVAFTNQRINRELSDQQIIDLIVTHADNKQFRQELPELLRKSKRDLISIINKDTDGDLTQRLLESTHANEILGEANYKTLKPAFDVFKAAKAAYERLIEGDLKQLEEREIIADIKSYLAFFKHDSDALDDLKEKLFEHSFDITPEREQLLEYEGVTQIFFRDSLNDFLNRLGKVKLKEYCLKNPEILDLTYKNTDKPIFDKNELREILTELYQKALVDIEYAKRLYLSAYLSYNLTPSQRKELLATHKDKSEFSPILDAIQKNTMNRNLDMLTILYYEPQHIIQAACKDIESARSLLRSKTFFTQISEKDYLNSKSLLSLLNAHKDKFDSLLPIILENSKLFEIIFREIDVFNVFNKDQILTLLKQAGDKNPELFDYIKIGLLNNEQIKYIAQNKQITSILSKQQLADLITNQLAKDEFKAYLYGLIINKQIEVHRLAACNSTVAAWIFSNVELRAMFTSQQAINIIVNILDRLDNNNALRAYISHLGIEHSDYALRLMENPLLYEKLSKDEIHSILNKHIENDQFIDKLQALIEKDIVIFNHLMLYDTLVTRLMNKDKLMTLMDKTLDRMMDYQDNNIARQTSQILSNLLVTNNPKLTEIANASSESCLLLLRCKLYLATDIHNKAFLNEITRLVNVHAHNLIFMKLFMDLLVKIDHSVMDIARNNNEFAEWLLQLPHSTEIINDNEFRELSLQVKQAKLLAKIKQQITPKTVAEFLKSFSKDQNAINQLTETLKDQHASLGQLSSDQEVAKALLSSDVIINQLSPSAVITCVNHHLKEPNFRDYLLTEILPKSSLVTQILKQDPKLSLWLSITGKPITEQAKIVSEYIEANSRDEAQKLLLNVLTLEDIKLSHLLSCSTKYKDPDKIIVYQHLYRQASIENKIPEDKLTQALSDIKLAKEILSNEQLIRYNNVLPILIAHKDKINEMAKLLRNNIELANLVLSNSTHRDVFSEQQLNDVLAYYATISDEAKNINALNLSHLTLQQVVFILQNHSILDSLSETSLLAIITSHIDKNDFILIFKSLLMNNKLDTVKMAILNEGIAHLILQDKDLMNQVDTGMKQFISEYYKEKALQDIDYAKQLLNSKACRIIFNIDEIYDIINKYDSDPIFAVQWPQYLAEAGIKSEEIAQLKTKAKDAADALSDLDALLAEERQGKAEPSLDDLIQQLKQGEDNSKDNPNADTSNDDMADIDALFADLESPEPKDEFDELLKTLNETKDDAQMFTKSTDNIEESNDAIDDLDNLKRKLDQEKHIIKAKKLRSPAEIRLLYKQKVELFEPEVLKRLSPEAREILSRRAGGFSEKDISESEAATLKTKVAVQQMDKQKAAAKSVDIPLTEDNPDIAPLAERKAKIKDFIAQRNAEEAKLQPNKINENESLDTLIKDIDTITTSNDGLSQDEIEDLFNFDAATSTHSDDPLIKKQQDMLENIKDKKILDQVKYLSANSKDVEFMHLLPGILQMCGTSLEKLADSDPRAARIILLNPGLANTISYQSQVEIAIKFADDFKDDKQIKEYITSLANNDWRLAIKLICSSYQDRINITQLFYSHCANPEFIEAVKIACNPNQHANHQAPLDLGKLVKNCKGFKDFINENLMFENILKDSVKTHTATEKSTNLRPSSKS